MRAKRIFVKLLVVFFVSVVTPTLTAHADLTGEIQRLEEHLQKAQAAQGPICAPETLAAAQACLASVKEEYEEGDYWEAEDLLEECRIKSSGLWERLLACEEDQDLDHVPNRLDRCPDDPETYNGYNDEDGCPDLVPERVMLTPRKIELLEPLGFDPTTQEPLEAAGAVLEDVARVLKENPSLRICIEVHMDNSFAPEKALDVSKRRASNVKRRLASLGIAASRLSPEGKGSREPVASNDSSYGRQLNQRVEFLRIP